MNCFKVRPPTFHVGRFCGIFRLRGARKGERFYACIFEQFAPCIFPSWRVASEFFCSSQLLIQEAAKGRGLTQTALSSEALGSLVALLLPARLVEEGQQRLCGVLVCGPPAVGARRPLGLGRGSRLAPPRDSDTESLHARKRSASPHAPQHTHTESVLHSCALTHAPHACHATARVASLAHNPRRHVNE